MCASARAPLPRAKWNPPGHRRQVEGEVPQGHLDDATWRVSIVTLYDVTCILL